MPNKKIRLWIGAGGLAVLLALGVVFWRGSRPLSLPERLQRLPASGAAIVYVDFEQLRAGGVLEMLGNAAEEPEYREFARRIHLDWRRDLDTALISLAPSGKYMLIEGRFDWKSLEDYAIASGGNCEDGFCRMTGSTPERRISFFRARRNLLALAVSTDDMAARRMQGVEPRNSTALPAAPVWMRIPGSVLKSDENLPAGTRMFARSVGEADSVTLLFVPEGDRLAAKLDIVCRDENDAAAMAGELTKATNLLREMIAREHQTPNPGDFSGVLTSGTFRGEGRRVVGHWPIERVFLKNLLGGGA